MLKNLALFSVLVNEQTRFLKESWFVKLPAIIQKHGKNSETYLKIKHSLSILKNILLGSCYVKIRRSWVFNLSMLTPVPLIA
jgi:hypothetical protein